MLLKTNEKTLATKFQMSVFKGAYNVVEQWNRPERLASAATRVMTVCKNFQFTLKSFHLTDVINNQDFDKNQSSTVNYKRASPKVTGIALWLAGLQ